MFYDDILKCLFRFNSRVKYVFGFLIFSEIWNYFFLKLLTNLVLHLLKCVNLVILTKFC